jgi:hypothetical protein
MNSNLLKAVAAIALAVVATSPLARAAEVSVADFKTEVQAKIGTKTGLKAANAAASYYGKVLKDKDNKKNADKYAKALIKALKKPSLKGVGAGDSVNACVKQLIKGYFKGLKLDINDKTYNKALTTILKGLPSTAKTAVTSQAIYNSIKAGFSKSYSQDQIYSYYTADVQSKVGNIPPPVS